MNATQPNPNPPAITRPCYRCGIATTLTRDGRGCCTSCAAQLAATSPPPPPCAICGVPSVPTHTVETGGGCDYPACGPDHAGAVWLALDAAQAHEDHPNTTAAPPWPVRHPPAWLGVAPSSATVGDLEAWTRDPKHAAALKTVRGA